MKRLICLALVSILCVSMCACSLPFWETEHVHTWLSATCTCAAVCEGCGETLGDPLPHSYGPLVTDLPAGKTTAGKQHATCTACGFVLNEEIPATGSEGLSYEQNEDGITVTGMGSCTDTELFIPAYIEGLPVTAIGTYAFESCEALTDIRIPETVTEIKAGAFAFCHGLTEVTLPDGVVTLGSGIFTGCENLQKVTLPRDYTGELDYTFPECESLREVVFPEGITGITNSCFRGCVSLTELQVPEGVTVIGMEAFRMCRNLQKIKLPASLTHIDHVSFVDCHSLTEIVYAGTMEQWKHIQKQEHWDNGTGDYTVICTDGTI